MLNVKAKLKESYEGKAPNVVFMMVNKKIKGRSIWIISVCIGSISHFHMSFFAENLSTFYLILISLLQS